MRSKEASIGDICEIKTPAGLAYIQYAHKDPDMGALVRVLPGLFPSRPSNIAEIARQKELYYTFYTLNHALRAKQTTVVLNEPVPDWAKPLPTMRHPGMGDAAGKTLSWIIMKAGTPLTLDFLQRAVKLRELTPDQEKLSINALWPHPVLVENLAKGWTPERAEEFRLKAMAEKQGRKSQQPNKEQSSESSMRHYLYFPKKSNAEKAALWFRGQGLSVDVRSGADGQNWLALVTQEPPKSEEEIEKLRDEMEALASQLDGEYDGWELAV